MPLLNTVANGDLFQYLMDVSTYSKFELSVLQVLLEERCNHMRDKKNEGKNEYELQVGDVVKAHVQVQSIAKRGIVDKLIYHSDGREDMYGALYYLLSPYVN